MLQLSLQGLLFLIDAYHAICQPICQLRTMQSTNPIYQLRITRSVNLSTSCVPCNQPPYISTICVQNHAINQSIYKLYDMQLISTVEADSKVISLLVNLYVQLLLDYL